MTYSYNIHGSREKYIYTTKCSVLSHRKQTAAFKRSSDISKSLLLKPVGTVLYQTLKRYFGIIDGERFDSKETRIHAEGEWVCKSNNKSNSNKVIPVQMVLSGWSWLFEVFITFYMTFFFFLDFMYLFQTLTLRQLDWMELQWGPGPQVPTYPCYTE